MQRSSASAERAGLRAAMQGGRIGGLDFLRALAALLVLVDHSGYAYLGGVAVFDGNAGVELFFALSGFLITSLMLDERERSGRIDLVGFYRRRAARLLPAFYAYLLLGLVASLLVHKPIPWGAVWSSAVYVVNYYQALTGAPNHYLAHCWSLAVEEQFYLLWPLAAAWLLRRKLPLAPWLAALVGGAWLLRAAYVGAGVSEEYLYRALETRIDQIACGALVAVLIREPRVRQWFERLPRKGWLLLVVLLVAILADHFMHDNAWLRFGVAHSLRPLLFALALPLTAMVAFDGVGRRVLEFAPMVLIGQVSYGIYLYHPLLIHPVRRFLEGVGFGPVASVSASIAVAIGVSLVSYRLFEQPLRAWIRGERRGVGADVVAASGR